MPDGPRGEYRRRRRTVRLLTVVTGIVFVVDIGAVAVSAQWAVDAASGLLLLILVVLVQEYLVTEHARRSSREAQLDAERLGVERTLFLSRVSHELRTPLGAILGFGQLLEREPLAPAQRETLEQMMTAGRHLLGMVDDLLDLSRIDAGGLRLLLEPVGVRDAVTEARALVSQASVSAAVGVRLRGVEEGLMVEADRQRLLQVLINLLSNAVKYNRRGGNVVISATREGQRVRIEVADTGIGIAQEAIGRLTTPFERAGAAALGIDGTGLGLAVARALVETMGGKLELRSEEGVGTSVSFDLPAATGPPAQSAPALTAPGFAPAPALAAATALPTTVTKPEVSAVPPAAHPAISVLYIEDNASLVRLVEKIFASASELTLMVAGEGAAGLSLARELRPDLIMLDLQLPDMSGEQVLSALLADPDTAVIPVLVVSADASPIKAKRLVAAGAAGYLTKPFDVDQLLSAVRARGAPQAVAVPGERPDSILEPTTVRSLHTLAGHPAVGRVALGEMLTTFRSDADSMLKALRAAGSDGDLVNVARQAHRLAGGAGAVGAERLRVRCRELELAAREGRAAEAQVLTDELEPLLDRSWDAIRAEFAHELVGISVDPELQSETVDIGESTGANR